MNSPKKLLFIGVAALTATFVFAQALTPEQRKAAEDALRSRMQEINTSQSASASKAAPDDKKAQKAEAEARRKAEAEAKKKAEADAKLAADTRKKAEAEAKKAADEAKRRADAEARRVAAEAKAGGKPAPAVVVVEQKPTAAKPVAVKAAAVPVPAPVIISASKLTPDQEAKAREALLVKMAELNARDSRPVATKVPETKVIVVKGSQTPTTTVVVAPTSAPVKAAPVVPEVAGSKLTPEQESAAREALRAKLATAPTGEAATAASSKSSLRLRSESMPEGLPISQEQWNQLASLTSAYKADKLTPQEYHARRAQIIAAKPAGGL